MSKRQQITPNVIARIVLIGLATIIYVWSVVAAVGIFSAWVIGASSDSFPAERMLQFVVLCLASTLTVLLLSWLLLHRFRTWSGRVSRIFLLGLGGIVFLSGAIAIVLVTSNSFRARIAESSSTQSVFPTVNVEDLYASSNAARASNGLAPLVKNDLLAESACLKVDDMIAKDYWSHTSPEGLSPWYFFDQVGYVYQKAGENLAYGYPDGAHVVTGWMGSPTHRDNVLGDYSEVGFCAKVAAKFQGTKNNVVVGHYGRPGN